MKTKKGMRLASALLAVLLAVCVLPQASLAELPDYLTITEKTGFATDPAAVPDSLNKGEVWVDRVARSAGDSPFATVEISALGRQFEATEQVLRKYNIMFVLDMSNSMAGEKCANMARAANDAVNKLVGNGNKLGVVTFGKTAKLNRGLLTTGFTLSEQQNPGSGKISVYPSSSNDIGGGTNIQAGLNVAYKELNKNLSDGAIPVIILLSDGAPTYYYNSIDAVTVSGTPSGTGNSTGVTDIALTVAQAAYLKAMMAGLRIYTIAFDINSADAKATLNPTDTNIGNVTGLAAGITSVKNDYVSNSVVRSRMVNSYADGWYSADASTTSLNEALASIIESIKVSGPIAESPVSATNPALSETSYVKITDTIGEGFNLSGTATVNLNGANYTFTRSGSTYTYSGSDVQIGKIVLTYSGDKLIWKIPGGVLPCIPSGSTVKPDPIKLTYTVELSGSDLEAKLYETSSKCEVWFTPAPDNPNYPFAFVDTVTEQNDIAMITQSTTYYKAVYTVSGETPTLLGVGSASTSGGPYTSITTTSPSLSGTKLTLQYNGKDIEFPNRTEYTETGTFKTSSNGKLSISSTIKYTPSSGSILSTTGASATKLTTTGSKITSLRADYTIDGIKCSQTFNSNLNTTSGTWAIPGNTLVYITTAAVVTTTSLYTYTESPQSLTLNIPGKTAVALTAGQVSNVTTTIEALEDGTIVASKITENDDGTFVLDEYTLSNGKLDIKTTTRTFSTTSRATQLYTINSAGSMLVISSDIISGITLTSEKGGATVTATPAVVNNVRDYKATVMLTFYAKAKFNSLSFALDAVNGSKTIALSGYTIIGWSQGLTRNADGTFSSNVTGPHAIVIQLTNPYKPSVPASFLVRFSGMSYKIGTSALKTIEHNTDYTGQQVKVVMNSPAKH